GVVADDRDPRNHAVDAPVELRDPARDLVEPAVCLIQPTLECDSEVDEVGAPAPEKRLLRRADCTKPAPRDAGEHERGDGESGGSDRDRGCSRRRPRSLAASRKKTGYVATLPPSCVPPGTRLIFTTKEALCESADGSTWRFSNDTVVCTPAASCGTVFVC